MTREPAKAKAPKSSSTKNDGGRTLKVQAEPGKSEAVQLAECATRGIVPLASVLTNYSKDTYSEEVALTEAYGELLRLSNASSAGDLAHLERLLSAQALTLNAVFAGLAHRAKTNSQAGYLGAADSYMRLALRAQAQCRQTAQTLFEMKNPRPIAFVQQANISSGPQQVNNGSFQNKPALDASNTRARALAGENEDERSKQLEAPNGQWLDTRAKGTTGGDDSYLAPVGEVNRTTHRSG